MPSSVLWAVDLFGHVHTLSTTGQHWESCRDAQLEFKRVSATAQGCWGIACDNQVYVYVCASDVLIRHREEAYENQVRIEGPGTLSKPLPCQQLRSKRLSGPGSVQYPHHGWLAWSPWICRSPELHRVSPLPTGLWCPRPVSALPQRWNPVGGFCEKLLPSDRWGWSDVSGLQPRQLDRVALPSPYWEWESDWYVDENFGGEPTEKGVGERAQIVAVWGGMPWAQLSPPSPQYPQPLIWPGPPASSAPCSTPHLPLQGDPPCALT